MSKYSRRVRIIESVDIPQWQYDIWKAQGTEVTPGLIRQTKEGIAAGLPNYQKLQAEKGFWEGPVGSVLRAIGIGAANMIPYVGPLVSAGVREADRQAFMEKTKVPAQPSRITATPRTLPTINNVQAANPDFAGGFPSLFTGFGGSSSGPYISDGTMEGDMLSEPQRLTPQTKMMLTALAVGLFIVVLVLVRR